MATNQEKTLNFMSILEKNNIAKISGIISSDAELLHERDGEKFYTLSISSKRLSGQDDMVQLTVPERLLKNGDINSILNKNLKLIGEFRSYNKLENSRSRLKLNFFVKEIKPNIEEIYENSITLKGYLCKKPIVRTTPFGREICDFLLAVNRNNSNKSDYLPCIAWGRNAKFVGSLEVGDKIELSGRMQSRDYKKTLEDGKVEDRKAYEISCDTVMIISKEQEKNVNFGK